MKKTVSLILAIALTLGALLSLTSCKDGARTFTPKSREISFIYFNTVSIISAYGDITDERLSEYAASVDECLDYYHKRLDIYFEYTGINNLRTLNKKAGKEPVHLDPEVLDFLEYCKELFTLTNGKTNVMMGAVLRIWHEKREDADYDPKLASLPTEEELRAASAHTSIDSLIIDREAGTAYISDPLASIDVGAIGKGYATERAYERLKEMGADSIALNIGGNIRTIGVRPDGSDWITGITNPDRSNMDFAARISFGETACVTSGDYERYYVVDGKKYHHIIDPDTLFPAGYFSSVTVVTNDSALADALSTALFCLPYSDGLALVESLDKEVDVLWINRDGSIVTTKGIDRVLD